MPNYFFRFRQFEIHQQHSAMKVCTDACLFGAWLAEELMQYKPKSGLDIGTGTGLLPLIIRQKNDMHFDCVELDEGAANEAQNNFSASPWPTSFSLHNISIQHFTANKKFDLIISNPPFFQHNLKSMYAKRNDALHDTSLSLHEMPVYINRFLTGKGIAAIMLPYQNAALFVNNAFQLNLFCLKQVNVRQTTLHSFFRSFLWLTRSKTNAVISSIAIKDEQDEYTDAFKQILKDYYLYL